MGTDALERGGQNLPLVLPVQPKPQAVLLFSGIRNGSDRKENRECEYVGRWPVNTGPDSIGRVTLNAPLASLSLRTFAFSGLAPGSVTQRSVTVRLKRLFPTYKSDYEASVTIHSGKTGPICGQR